MGLNADNNGMFRLSFLVLLLLFSTTLFGQTDFNYLKPKEELSEVEKNELVQSITQNFPSYVFVLPQPFYIDTVHVSADSSKVVIMKFGYAPDDKQFFKKLHAFEKGFLYHSQTKTGAPYALYFEGMQESEVREFLSLQTASANRVKSKSFLLTMSNLIIPSAYATADDCPPNQSGFIPDWLKHTGVQAGSCLIGVLKGAWDSTGGAVAGIGQAIIHPIESAKAVWNGASKFWAGVEAFRKDMKASLKKVSAAYASMPEGAFTELSCRIASALGTGALVAYFTLGAGAPSLMLKIAKLLERIDHLPGVAQISQKLATAGGSGLSVLGSISSKLARSSSVRFMKANKMARMDANTLTPGKSYTVVIYQDKLIIGEDMISDTGGTAGTHVSMMETLRAKDIFSYDGLGGAIKVHPNGVIDVAGYHLKHYSTPAAKAIADKLKSIIPDLQIRQSGGKLGAFPPLEQ